MAKIRESQLRLVYSLLRTPLRLAARFRVPMGTLTELVRVAYFETVRGSSMTQAEVARRLGQTDRHIRTLTKKHAVFFVQGEVEAGIVPEMEALVAERAPLPNELAALLASYSKVEVRRALEELLAGDRIVRGENGRLQVSERYASLTVDTFQKRLAALNEHLDVLHQAVLHRLVYNDQQRAMLKTASFRADPSKLAALVSRLEGDIRRELATLDEDADFSEAREASFVIAVSLAPAD